LDAMTVTSNARSISWCKKLTTTGGRSKNSRTRVHRRVGIATTLPAGGLTVRSTSAASRFNASALRRRNGHRHPRPRQWRAPAPVRRRPAQYRPAASARTSSRRRPG
jgi:hypothetical protein